MSDDERFEECWLRDFGNKLYRLVEDKTKYDYYKTGWNSGYNAALSSQWTPASQPPEEAGWYNVTVKRDDNKPFSDVDEYFDDGWVWNGMSVVAYQPLPPAYQPKEDV
jgi:hypothetical protein